MGASLHSSGGNTLPDAHEPMRNDTLLGPCCAPSPWATVINDRTLGTNKLIVPCHATSRPQSHWIPCLRHCLPSAHCIIVPRCGHPIRIPKQMRTAHVYSPVWPERLHTLNGARCLWVTFTRWRGPMMPRVHCTNWALILAPSRR